MSPILKLLSLVSSELCTKYGDLLIGGLLSALKEHELTKETLPLIAGFLSSATMNPAAMSNCYELVTLLMNSGTLLSIDNYGEFVDLFLSFPSATASLFVANVIHASPQKSSERDSK